MPRTSRHKSSKHSSRDARDYSDSEKDSSSKDRKSKDESCAKILKESASGEKRKLDSKDSKDSFASGNGDYLEEYLTSKRRRERVDDANDRWNGGDDDRGEGTKKLKEKVSESKSKRRDESTGAYEESDEVVKKSSGRTEGKHLESSSRKEGREGGAEREREKEKERDRRGKEGKNDKLIDVEDQRSLKQLSEKTELSVLDLLKSSEMDNLPDRRIRKKRDDSGNGDKNHEDLGDSSDRHFSSREDDTKDGKMNEEKHKDERYRDKYREHVNRESRHHDDKQKDQRVGKDRISNISDAKNSRDDKDSVEIRLKKHKPQDGDCEQDHDCDRDFDIGRNNDHESCQRERDRDRDLDRERDRDRDRDWDRDRDRDRERDRNGDRNIDYYVLPIDDRNARYKDSRGRKRSPDDYDEYADTKSRGVKTAFLDIEKRYVSSRVESDPDRGSSQSRQAHTDNNVGGNRRRTSPDTSSIGVADECRQLRQEDLKYKDAELEHRSSKPISSRDVTSSISGASERTSKYRSSDKHCKIDDGHVGELLVERSSSSKASPVSLVDKSPSSTSLERRYTSRASVRRILDIEESGRRSNASMGSRDLPSSDDRRNRDLPLEKSQIDDLTSVDSAFYNRTSQSNSALIPLPSAFRGGVGSPSFMGSLDEDGRISVGARYKRGGDPNFGRGQGNAWRGAPNWSSPLPNRYIPFQHGPHPGAFQAILPQFPSPPLFGVRPSMEINHSGISYHISDADRFASHLRPLGWQNMMDGSGPAHMHGWEGNNGVFRDESHIYRPDWDQTRHSMNGRGWQDNADIWKAQNGDMNLDLPSTSLKEDVPVLGPVEDVSAAQGGQRSQKEGNLGFQTKAVETKTLENDSYKTSPKTTFEKTLDPPKSMNNKKAHPYDAHLSQLDISTELADPELYEHFASLLRTEQSITAKKDATMLVNLKDGARAVSKSSSILLSSSLFPATSDSVFQRAMGIYKRQRGSFGGLPNANDGIIDVILESKMEEEVPLNNGGIAEEPVENYNDEISDVKERKVETSANVAVLEVSEVNPIKEVGVDADEPDPKSESSDQGLSHDIPHPEKPMMGSSGSGKELSPSKPVDSVKASSPIGVPDKTQDEYKTMERGINGKTEGSSNTLNREEDGKWGSLFSPKTESNESESVILSRIHSSSESTH